MNLNKLKLYLPTTSSGDALDQPFSPLWAGSTTGRTANSIFNLIESLGKFSRIITVDAVYGNDYSATPPMQAGQRESILRPFKDINVAIYFMQAGDVMVVMPGTYNITNFPGLVPKDNTTFLLLNAELTYSGAYSPFFTYPSPSTGVKVIGVGNSFITKTTRNGWGGTITPYTGLTQIEFHNLTLTAPEQAVAGLGAAGLDGRIIDFYNCRILQTDSQVNTASGGGAGSCSMLMKNCYVRGYTYIHDRTASRPEFVLKAMDCFFQAINTNTNGRVNILDIGEYYGDTTPSVVLLEGCCFLSEDHAIEVGVGYGGFGANKKLLLYDCKFMTGAAGWVLNNHPGYEFKLLHNVVNNPATGSDPVVNILSGPGITLEPNLEIYPP